MKKLMIYLLLLCLSLFLSNNLFSNFKNEKKNNNEILYAKVYDNKYTTKSNVKFFNSNYGILANDLANNSGGCFWPKNSQNEYIFGGGFWFAGKKKVSDTLKTFVEMSYNPNSGGSNMMPGRIEDGLSLDTSLSYKYLLYDSNDYDSYSGASTDPNNSLAWPLWKETPNNLYNRFGNYVIDLNSRNRNQIPLGPSFYSDEEIFCVYRDTDKENNPNPAGLQYEQNLFAWDTGYMKDCIIIRYKIVNKSVDTIYNCWFAPIYDYDVGIISNQNSWSNDRTRYCNEEDSLNLGIVWTNTDCGEKDLGFGYAGISFLETPTVDSDRYIKLDNSFYPINEQIGLTTFRNCSLFIDLSSVSEKYNYISSFYKDGDDGPKDIRVILGCGPFNFRPGDTAVFSVLLGFALPAVSIEADGSTADCQNILDLVRKARGDYYSMMNMTSVDEKNVNIDKNNELIISPNPATYFIEIASKNQTESYLEKISIYNSLGEIVLISKNMNTENIRIDVSSLSAGLYFVRVGDMISKFVKI